MENRRLLTVAINEFGGAATLDMTAGITTGPDGNLWFTETGSLSSPTGAIGRITPSGAIQQFTAGLSVAGVPTGITTGPDGALWFTEYGGRSQGLPFGASAIGRIDPVTDQITEFTANLTPNSGPSQITTGPDGALWFTENTGNQIGRIDPTTKQITEFSTGLSANSQPVGITVGPDGALWFAESNTDLIGRITTAGAITEFGAGIIPTSSAPTGITVGSDNNLWFTEHGSSSNPAGGIGRITVGGTITQFSTGLTAGSGPAGITAGPNGNLFFTEEGSGLVGEITTQGVITEFSQNPPTSSPAVITQGPDGNLWFTELTGTHVDRITPAGVLTQFPKADAITSGGNPRAIVAGPGNALYFAETGADKLGKIDLAGNIQEFSQGITAGSVPGGLTLGPDGNIWFIEFAGFRIGRFNPSTSAIAEFPLPSRSGGNPLNIVTGSDGNLWFVQQGGQVGQINPTTLVITLFNVPGAINLQNITAGPDGNLWFTDGGADQIDRITTQGVITKFNLPSSGGFPEQITTGSDGNLWFTEDFGDRIGRISPTSGTIAEFPLPTAGSRPVGIAPGPDGSLYFTEFNGNRIGRINPSTLVIAELDIPTPSTSPTEITPGPDGNVWFTESTANQIGQAVLPQSSVTTVPTGPFNVAAGQPLGLPLLNFSDASPAANAANFAAAIDFGDGSPVVTAPVTPLASGGFTVNSPHTYANPGQYNLILTVFNSLGQAAPVQELVTVTAPPSNVVINTNDAGRGSLRQAIINANQNPGTTITFAIPAALTNSANGVATIIPLSPLPQLINKTTIDGTSQASFEGKPAFTVLIQIDGSGAGATSGLVFAKGSAGSILEGVSVLGFAGNQVEFDDANQTLRDSYVGVAADSSTGSSIYTGSAGVYITGANALIGGIVATDRNVISNNGYHGVLFTGAGATGGMILSNDIGGDPTGLHEAPNGGDGIVAIDGAGGLTIMFNVIGGNDGNGVELYGSSGNLIAGNLIGVDITGSGELDNEGSGICVDAGSKNNTIGGTGGVAGNVISDNDINGVAIQGGSSGNVVAGNRIGTVYSGQAGFGNGVAGILVSESAGNVIGPGNLVSGNGAQQPGAGIWIDGTEANGNMVFGNKVGTDIQGETAIPNVGVGIVISQGSANMISNNLVSGNTLVGVEVANSSTAVTPLGSANVIQANVIGLDASGRKAIGNGGAAAGAGLYILNSPGNTVGGASLALGNVISGNNFDGVDLFGPATTNNRLEFNRIGTNGSGTGACGNKVDGLVFDGTPANLAVSNYITSNGRNGVFISNSSNIHLELDLIGVGVGGQALGNGGFGILITNNSPGTTLVGLENFNNLMGPLRNTDTLPATGSRGTTTNPSVTGHGSASASASSRAKHSVKIQPSARSFGGRKLAKAPLASKSKSKH